MTPEQMQTLGIPAEYHREQIFIDAPDLPTVFKVARDLNAYKGNSIRVPGPESSDVDRTEFEQKLKKHAPHLIALPKEDDKREAFLLENLGVPKKAEEYAPPADHGLSDADIERLRGEAAEEKLTKRQFQTRVERAKAARALAQKAQTEALAGLKKDLGAAFEERLGLAAAVAKKLGAEPEFVAAIQKGEAPVSTIKQYLTVAKSLGEEESGLSLPGGARSGKLTPDEINSRIQEIYRNPAFMQKGHPQFPDLQKKLLEYNEMLGEGEEE
jgi:hypothetical protein